MTKTYDTIIVGAGPAGLQAALVAARHGLKTALIEKKQNVSRITRACCQLLVLDAGYQKEHIKVDSSKIIFPRNGFEVPYDGKTQPVTDKYYLSPSVHQIHFAHKDKRPIAFRFDKGRLLQGLWESCEQAGVQLISGAVAYEATETGTGVELKLTRGTVKSTVRALKLIIADGVNSRIVESLGMNRGRTLFTNVLSVIYFLEGVKDHDPHTFKNCNGLAYYSTWPIILGPSLETNVMDLGIPACRQERSDQVFEKFTTRGPLAYMFEKAKIIEKTGCAVKARSPMQTPYRGNALAIGDAAALVEVQTQGGLMCGFHAANAVLKELNGENGFDQYTRWWQNTFEFNSEEHLRVAQGYALVPAYSDDELDYLFALTEDEVLEGSLSQYKTPKLMWDSMLRHKDRIASERPELYEKIKSRNTLTL
jgi:digeranylgeranylglycerophospholipid reductase